MSREPSRHPLWRAARIIVGVALIPLGIVGLFVPVLQGVLLLLLAFALLAKEIPWLRRFGEELSDRFPGISKRHDSERR